MTKPLTQNLGTIDLGRNIDELLAEIGLTIEAKRNLKERYQKTEHYYNDNNVRAFSKEQILSKTNELRGNADADICLIIALMNRANKLVTGYELRPAQILSTLEFFRTNEDSAVNKFCQVNTGEGKTTLTSLIAVIKTLQGSSVDVITSNEVLAYDAVRDRGDFYALFGLSVAHNNANHGNNGNRDGTKDCYKHDIVYGTISNFEFDYLRQKMKFSEVKGSRECGSLIIDEADNVVLDNATSAAKLSSPIAGMEYLQYVFINIWQTLIKTEHALSLRDRQADEITEEEKSLIKLVMFSVKAHIKSDSAVPKFLESYVDRKLDVWIKNAIHARYDYHQNQHYIIAKKDTQQQNANVEESVIPLDVRVGVTLQNTIWTNLHPFVQLKHNLQVTPDSLSSVFIPNSEYIRLYKSVSGLTGTLGSLKEREIIKTLYDADSTVIPTYKAGLMKYETNKLVSDGTWAEAIAKDALAFAQGKQRATLVICETVQDVIDLAAQVQKARVNERVNIITYMDEHDAHKIELINTTGGIEPRTVVIATNIGGRGTDIKLSDEVRENGGLHECTTFISLSSRILKQASGRAARQGEPGSTRMIIKQSDLEKYGINLEDNFSNETIYDLVDGINDSRIARFVPQINRAAQNNKYFTEFAELYTKNKLLGMNYFVLEDLKVQWALAFDEGNILKIKKVFKKLADAAEEVENYEHQFVNPYFAIKYVDYILSTSSASSTGVINDDNTTNNKDKSETEDKLLGRAQRVLNQECVLKDSLLAYAAGMKNFEILLTQRQHNKLKQLAEGTIANSDYSTLPEQEYQAKVKVYLENAQKTLTAKIKYLQNIVASKDFHQIVLAKCELNNDGENYLLKHIKSEYAALLTRLHHVNSLIAVASNSASGELYISDKYNLNELASSINNSLGVKIHAEELAQVKNLGEDAFYKLGVLPTSATTNQMTNPTTIEAVREVGSLFAKSALSFSFRKSATTPSSADLLDSGIFDIIRVILAREEDHRSSAGDEYLSAFSFGLAKGVKCLQILRQVSEYVSGTVSQAWSASKMLNQFIPQVAEGLEEFTEKLKEITPGGVIKTKKKLPEAAITFDPTMTLAGNDTEQNADIGLINSYFGKYTLEAIKSILSLRIQDAGVANTNLNINNIKIASGDYAFISGDNNNISGLLAESYATDASIILSPVSLFGKHAAGLMLIKDQTNLSNFTVYYIDPENQKIPLELEQIFKNHRSGITQLTVEPQKYANCGPEVIENFMLYLTGKRLPQEEALRYHSLLVEQDLLSDIQAPNYEDIYIANTAYAETEIYDSSSLFDQALEWSVL